MVIFMAHDVFISYSIKDKNVADAICSAFEINGIRCWIAPRDINAGQEWAEAIIDSISISKAMVIIFSSNSNSSKQVLREVERAVNKEVPILPFRIENIQPSKSMEYYLSIPHWLDALTEPMESHIRQLVKNVMDLLGADYVKNLDPPSFNDIQSKDAGIESNCDKAYNDILLEKSPEEGKNKSPIDEIMDVPLVIRAIVGKTLKPIKEILEFGIGSIIELDKKASELFDVLVNNKLLAKAEVVIIDENFGIRIIDIIDNKLKSPISVEYITENGSSGNNKLSHKSNESCNNEQIREAEKINEKEHLSPSDINLIMDVPLEITVELGSTKKLIRDILEFSAGTLLELDKLSGEPVDILVNGKVIANGEVIVIDESFGVRITNIVQPLKRIKM